MFLSRIIDIVSDPVIGFMSDRFLHVISYKTWVMLGIPLYLIALTALFNPSTNTTKEHLFFIILAVYIFRSTFDVPHNALAASATSSNAIRLELYGLKSVFLVSGVLATGGAVTIALGDIDSALSLISYVAWCFSAFCLILFYYFAPRENVSSSDNNISILKSYIIKPRIKTLLIAFFLNQIGNAFAASLVIIYIQEVLKLSPNSGVFLGGLFLASALSVPIWLRISSRFSMSSVWFGSVSISIPVFFSVCFLDQGDFGYYLIVCLVAGALFGADAIFPPAMLARLLDQNEGIHSHAFGAMFASKSALSKLSLVIPVIIAFPVIEYYQEHSIEKYSNSIVFFYAIFPLLPKILSLVFIRKLKLTMA